MLLNLFQAIDPQSQGFKTHHGYSIVYLFIFIYLFIYLFICAKRKSAHRKRKTFPHMQKHKRFTCITSSRSPEKSSKLLPNHSQANQ